MFFLGQQQQLKFKVSGKQFTLDLKHPQQCKPSKPQTHGPYNHRVLELEPSWQEYQEIVSLQEIGYLLDVQINLPDAVWVGKAKMRPVHRPATPGG